MFNRLPFTVVCILGAIQGSFGEEVGLIGGEDFSGAPPYAAVVLPDGTVTNLASNGEINSIALNSQGIGLIGGQNGIAPYAALVSSTGVVTDLPLGGDSFPSRGTIKSVAINNQEAGLIGGRNQATLAAYAALISPTGTVTNLPQAGDNLPSSGIINSVAIDGQGAGLIGGRNNSGPAYVALVSSTGTVTNLPHGGGPGNLPSSGVINSVAINSQGAGLVGGYDSSGDSPAYAALVSSTGTITNLPNSGGTGNLPAQGRINSVAINSQGAGLIGGFDDSNPAYAALVSATGTVTNLPNSGGTGNLPSSGVINSVAINSQGVGLIGGFDNSGDSPAYAALVSPSGSVTNLPNGGGTGNLPSNGVINSVAINSQGICLIGGQDNSGDTPAYAALVSPSGIVTNLPNSGGMGNLPSSGEINSVAILEAATPDVIFNALVPSSTGVCWNAIQTLLAASFAYENHVMIQHKRPWNKSSQKSSNISLLANLDEKPPSGRYIEKPKAFSIWGAPFGELAYQKAQGSLPALRDQIIGALVGLDYHGISNTVLGGGISYAFDYVHESASQGHFKINQEAALLYASFRRQNLFVNATLWGGLYQFENVRHSLGFITSTAHAHGYLLSPHLEVAGMCLEKQGLDIEAFALFDWVNSWQKHFTEQGSSGFNLVMPNLYASLLRSELGFRFYETVNYGWGRLLFEEKASYINLAPFNFSSVNTGFIGSISNFSIAIGSNKVQNLGGLEAHCSFLPWNEKYPYGSIDFQGQFGSSYQTYFASVQIGKKF